jgi:hypothetical protein
MLRREIAARFEGGFDLLVRMHVLRRLRGKRSAIGLPELRRGFDGAPDARRRTAD